MPKVRIFSAVWCPWCKKTKDWMSAHKTPFEEIDVEKDTAAAQEMVEKTGQRGIPVTEINGEYIVGYDVEAFKKKLKIKG